MNRVDCLIAAFPVVYFQRIASVFFFVFFLLVIVRVLLLPSRESAHASRLPLEDDDWQPQSETHACNPHSSVASTNNHGSHA